MLTAESAALTSELRIPPDLMELYFDIEAKQPFGTDWRTLDERTLWERLALCILSSNVYYETARSALDQLRYRGMLDSLMDKPEDKFAKTIAGELQRPVYLPRRLDGSFRRYRFPNVRARDLVGAAQFVYGEIGSLHSLLHGFDSNTQARRFLSLHISGLGLKEASHFLRDIGYSADLAIIDVHIVSFLRELALIDDRRNFSITARVYDHLESLCVRLLRH